MITKIVTAIIIDFIELFIFEYLLAPCNLNKCSLYFIISETASLSLFEYIFLLILLLILYTSLGFLTATDTLIVSL